MHFFNYEYVTMPFFKLNFYFILIFNTEFNKYSGIFLIMNMLQWLSLNEIFIAYLQNLINIVVFWMKLTFDVKCGTFKSHCGWY